MEEAELRRLELLELLERLEPGITHVKWGEEGFFILEDQEDLPP